MRSVALAGAGGCAALLFFVLQDETLRVSAQWVLACACVGLPLLLAAAFITENYMHHGEAAYKRLQRPVTFVVMTAVFFTGGIALTTGIFLLLRHFSSDIAWVFLVASAGALVLTMWHHTATRPGP
jgi:cation transport ATPase